MFLNEHIELIAEKFINMYVCIESNAVSKLYTFQDVRLSQHTSYSNGNEVYLAFKLCYVSQSDFLTLT